MFSGRYLQTQPGGYGEGDQLLGLPVPQQRQLARQYEALPPEDLNLLITSPIHEHRQVALFIAMRQAGRSPQAGPWLEWYLRHRLHINNWDLVDGSAPQLLGALLPVNDTSLLDELAADPHLWTRRMAMVATLFFIRRNQFSPAWRLAETLLYDPHPLLHKAVGWMLREIGKRDEAVLLEFLETHAAAMPRLTLRYAIERLSLQQKKDFMGRKNATR